MDATMHVSAGAPSVAWRANAGLANQVDAYAVHVRVSYNDMLLLQ